MMSKVKLGDMTYADRKEYRYYKRLLTDYYIYGPRYLKEMAENTVAKIENKYARGESDGKN